MEQVMFMFREEVSLTEQKTIALLNIIPKVFSSGLHIITGLQI